MLTSEDVFKNRVLPSRIIGAGVNSLNNVHRTSGHTHHTSQTNGISEIEADMGSEMMQKLLQLKGGRVSRGISDIGINNISCLQSDSVTEINRHHHQVFIIILLTQEVQCKDYLLIHFVTIGGTNGVALAFIDDFWILELVCSSTDLRGQRSGHSELSLTSPRVAESGLIDKTHSRSLEMMFTMQPLKLI
jgi:hypothetical protein